MPVIPSDHNNTDPMLMPLAVLVMVTLSKIMMKDLLVNRVPILVLIKVLVICVTLTNIDGDKFLLGSDMHITLMLTIIVLLTMEVQFFVIGAKLALTISCQCGNSKLT